MADYKKLVTTTARVTANTPLLWFFGLCLSAGFNFNWFYLSRAGFMESARRSAEQAWHGGAVITQQFMLPAFLLLALAVVVWLAVNWIKVAFVLNVADILGVKRLGNPDTGSYTIWQKQRQIFRQARKSLPAVAGLSLFTILAQSVVTFVLFGPLLWERYITPLPGLIVLAGALFIIFMLFFALLNFFAVLYASLYQKNFSDAFSLAVLFLKTKAGPLSVACAVLLALYAAGVFAGVEIAGALRYASYGLKTYFGLFSLNREIDLLFLLWFGFLNAFFNVGLFAFFIGSVRPKEMAPETNAKTNLVLKVSVDKTF